jgi:alpha/beta superfamily hydrolase
MSQDADAVLARLADASKGLSFPSEADYPIEPFLIQEAADDTITPAAVLKAMKHAPNAPSRTMTVDEFFATAAEEQDWQNAAERQTARRFQELVKVLRQNLNDLQVIKVGKVEQDVYVVGRTSSGALAGIKTKVVQS